MSDVLPRREAAGGGLGSAAQLTRAELSVDQAPQRVVDGHGPARFSV